MQWEELCATLDAMTDPSASKYQNTVITDTNYPMRYIRVPAIRDLAKKAAPDWQRLAHAAQFATYEEVLAVGLAVAYARVPLAEKLPTLRRLLPRLDSWALTDCIAPTLKWKDEENQTGWNFAMECLGSPMEYTIRFGIVLLMRHFLTAESIPATAEILCNVTDPRYYVQMAVAWCLAEMGTQDFSRVEDILKAGILPTFTHNMTIRKLRESYRISPEQKAAAAKLRKNKEKQDENTGC